MFKKSFDRIVLKPEAAEELPTFFGANMTHYKEGRGGITLYSDKNHKSLKGARFFVPYRLVVSIYQGK